MNDFDFKKILCRACKLVQLETDDEANDVCPPFLEGTCEHAKRGSEAFSNRSSRW